MREKWKGFLIIQEEQEAELLSQDEGVGSPQTLREVAGDHNDVKFPDFLKLSVDMQRQQLHLHRPISASNLIFAKSGKLISKSTAFFLESRKYSGKKSQLTGEAN